jgi:hypothetical protein
MRLRWRHALVFADLALAHGIVVLIKLINCALSLRNGLLAAGLGPLVTCFDLLILTLAPLPVEFDIRSTSCGLEREPDAPDDLGLLRIDWLGQDWSC